MKRSKSDKPSHPALNDSVVLQLDEKSMFVLVEAANIRRVSVAEYVRTIAVAHAKAELADSNQHEIAMTAGEQLKFWRILQRAPKVSESQHELGKLMRGER